jgi:hypothetical protein
MLIPSIVVLALSPHTSPMAYFTYRNVSQITQCDAQAHLQVFFQEGEKRTKNFIWERNRENQAI